MRHDSNRMKLPRTSGGKAGRLSWSRSYRKEVSRVQQGQGEHKNKNALHLFCHEELSEHFCLHEGIPIVVVAITAFCQERFQGIQHSNPHRLISAWRATVLCSNTHTHTCTYVHTHTHTHACTHTYLCHTLQSATMSASTAVSVTLFRLSPKLQSSTACSNKRQLTNDQHTRSSHLHGAVDTPTSTPTHPLSHPRPHPLSHPPPHPLSHPLSHPRPHPIAAITSATSCEAGVLADRRQWANIDVPFRAVNSLTRPGLLEVARWMSRSTAAWQAPGRSCSTT